MVDFADWRGWYGFGNALTAEEPGCIFSCHEALDRVPSDVNGFGHSPLTRCTEKLELSRRREISSHIIDITYLSDMNRKYISGKVQVHN